MNNATIAKWETKSLTMGWHEFVCAYVAHKTARRTDCHKIKKVGDMWELTFGGLALFAPMTASTAYSWFVRTAGLCSFAREADDIRMKAHMSRGLI